MTISDWINLVAAILIGGGTLALAFMTWKSIQQTRSIQKRERLAHILDWAEDIIGLTQIIKTPEPPSLDKDIGTETYERLEQKSKINSFNGVKSLGDHMKILSFRIDKELCAMVSNLIQAIDDLLNEDWQSFDLETTRYWLTEHEKRIYDIAQDLVADITKRLQRD
jgi:hypothetical protein